MHPTARWRESLFLALVLAAAGCATLPQNGAVSTSLVGIVPQQSSLFETTAQLTLRFTNEGPAAVVLTGGTHRISVNGTPVGRAVSNERVTLAALGTTTLPVTAYFENLTLLRKAQELGQSAAVDYRIESRLFVEGGGAVGAVATGQLDLRGLMPPGAAAAGGG